MLGPQKPAGMEMLDKAQPRPSRGGTGQFAPRMLPCLCWWWRQQSWGMQFQTEFILQPLQKSHVPKKRNSAGVQKNVITGWALVGLQPWPVRARNLHSSLGESWCYRGYFSIVNVLHGVIPALEVSSYMTHQHSAPLLNIPPLLTLS